MKIDLYTKTVLTVIAVVLSINLLTDFDIMPKAYANNSSQKTINVKIVDVAPYATMDIDIRQIGGSPISKGTLKNGRAFLLVDDASEYGDIN